jgi:hypothetical protein
MITSKQWIKLSLTSTLLGATLLATFNATIDPLNILHTSLLKVNSLTNERFIKIEYLEEHHKNFNSYMIGSSRIGTTPPTKIEQYIPHSKFYNLTLQEATLYDYLIHIRYMIKKRYTIKNLYIELDIDTMNYYNNLSKNYLYKPHPYVEDHSLALFYFHYLMRFYPLATSEKIRQNITPTLKVQNIIESGIWKNPSAEKALNQNCKAYTDTVSPFHTNYQRILKYSTKKETIHALKEIVAMAERHQIKLYLFITPHNHKMMDSFLLNDYLEYLADIVNITDVYDFSGYNSITTDDCNYYEISHYRPHIGELIAARIFKSQTVKVPEDFGVLLTKEHLNGYLNEQREKIERYDRERREPEKLSQ